MLPFPSDIKFQPACHCFHVFQDGKWVQVDANNPKLIAPAIIKQASNPGLDQMAIDARFRAQLR